MRENMDLYDASTNNLPLIALNLYRGCKVLLHSSEVRSTVQVPFLLGRRTGFPSHLSALFPIQEFYAGTIAVVLLCRREWFNKDKLSIQLFGPVRPQSCRQPRKEFPTGSCPRVIRVDLLGTGGRDREG